MSPTLSLERARAGLPLRPGDLGPAQATRLNAPAQTGLSVEPSARGFIALLEAFRATGGTVPGHILDGLLTEHGGGVGNRLASLFDAGQVFGFEWRGHVWVPMFQFDADDLSLRADPQAVRAALPAKWTDWAVATWFATPQPRLAERCPVDRIGPDVEAVLRTARAVSAPRVRTSAPASRRELEWATQT